jgi:hypothetical protein
VSGFATHFGSRRITVLFGMGRRGSRLLWPPDRRRRVNSYKVICRFALRLEPLYEAEIVAVVERSTMPVFTVKVALVAPAGTVTLAGTTAARLLLESVTCAPPAGAGALSVTVPVEDPRPPTTLVGLRVSEERTAAGITVSDAVRVAPP